MWHNHSKGELHNPIKDRIKVDREDADQSLSQGITDLCSGCTTTNLLSCRP
jgi:hypothetical protein